MPKAALIKIIPCSDCILIDFSRRRQKGELVFPPLLFIEQQEQLWGQRGRPGRAGIEANTEIVSSKDRVPIPLEIDS